MTAQQFAEIKSLAARDAGWNVLRDYLVLALDQVESGAQDRIGTADLVAYLRPALQLAHARMEALSA